MYSRQQLSETFERNGPPVKDILMATKLRPKISGIPTNAIQVREKKIEKYKQ